MPAAVSAAPGDAPRKSDKTDKAEPAWLGEELPLPLAARTPQDLSFKAAAERQYLIFNLLARGKLAFDQGDFALATTKWEALLRLPGLDPELARVVDPLAVEARRKAGTSAPAPAAPVASASSPAPTGDPSAPLSSMAGRGATRSAATVSGQVSGGGERGPGGTVLWLKRRDGSTPRPAPVRGKSISQANKVFSPRVLPVTVGSKVDFRNQDDIYHNVFSLSRPNDFDAGLYKSGESYSRTFNKPGPVQLLCNIHSSMIAYVVVLDTPYYGQADASGSFSIKGVPPGEYDLEAWHEGASAPERSRLTVPTDGVRNLNVRLGSARKPPAFVPDKYGKPRQAQLGY